jgi:hypothetical protein
MKNEIEGKPASQQKKKSRMRLHLALQKDSLRENIAPAGKNFRPFPPVLICEGEEIWSRRLCYPAGAVSTYAAI